MLSYSVPEQLLGSELWKKTFWDQDYVLEDYLRVQMDEKHQYRYVALQPNAECVVYDSFMKDKVLGKQDATERNSVSQRAS